MIHSVCVLIIAVSGVFFSAANAEIYRYLDESGRVVYSNEKPASNATAQKVIIRQNTISTIDSYDEMAAKSVVMYSASWCGVCKHSRAYFDDHGIIYDELDVENDAQGKQVYARLGSRGIPIILVRDRRMDGFSIARFQQPYSAHN